MNTFRVTELLTDLNIENVMNILENGSIKYRISIQNQTIINETYNFIIAKELVQRIGFEIVND